MASSDFTGIPEQGTTFLFASWLYVADGLGGFTSHLADQLDEIPLPVHVENPIRRKSPAELE